MANRKRVTFAYAVLNPSSTNGGKRKTLTSYPLSLRGPRDEVEDDVDLYDEMPPHTERGHLLADVFGGADHERNLVPMSRVFNQQTWKQQVEAVLTTLAAKHSGELLGLRIQCVYGAPNQDPRIPVGYVVRLYSFGTKSVLRSQHTWSSYFMAGSVRAIPMGYHLPVKALFSPFKVEQIREIKLATSLPSLILPDADITIVAKLDLGSLQTMARILETPLLQAQQDMMTANWKLEGTACSRGFDFKLPPVDLRPYAVLDYMLSTGELGRLFPKLAKKDLALCFRSKGFADWQRELIFAANMVLHDQESLLISDNQFDEVYREVQVLMNGRDPGEEPTMGRYEYAVREWRNGLPATSPEATMHMPRGALFLDSTAFAPQIDHIIAKAGAKNGTDAFSNAQVVSGKWNRAKSNQTMVQGIIERARVPKTRARKSKVKTDFRALALGRLERNSKR
ncbi:DNA/RNA non-specific endonuclease [Trinickia sp. NRRL B-1857]|uniref:DNA/RNA non-specific endonuclease n=1 Tax=Trinickia sp. NRRL B-1857 TaxID=3162879 RepID=UPI003D2B6355